MNREALINRQERLRWFVGVPVGTNPLILLDGTILLIIGWALSVVMLLLLQRLFGGSLRAANLVDAATVALYLSMVFVVFYCLVAFVILRNGYVALYRLEHHGAFCENQRVRWPLFSLRPLTIRGYAVEAPQKVERSVERQVAWADVTRVQPLASLRVLLLRRRRGTAMRIYCPDEVMFQQAWHFAARAIGTSVEVLPESTSR